MDNPFVSRNRRIRSMTLQETLNRIKGMDSASYQGCLVRWNAVAKPLYSLGLLETFTARMAGTQGTDTPHLTHPRVLVFCADNGVVAEGVTQSDSSVTTAVAESLAAGCSNVNIMARCAGADVETYDVGMVTDGKHPAIHKEKLCHGTKNLAVGPAMTEEEAVFAIEVGIRAVEQAKADGCDILVAGEMGIGNTTSSTAIMCVLLGLDSAAVTGRGSGLDDAGLLRKQNAIRRGIEVNRPDPANALDVLRKVGGFDIAAMCGVYLGGAALGIPVVLDGLISGAAALIAHRFAPLSADAMLPSHQSHEPGGSLALDALGFRAPICADLALGEGTGGVALLPLLQMALAVLNGEHSFGSLGMDAYTPQS